jgi:hypothetical protein
MTNKGWWAIGAALLQAAAAEASAPLVRCESIEGKRQVCALDSTWGVQLARQLGGSSCEAGKSWGWNPGAVWVEENCRGEFRAVYEEQEGETIVTCDSDHNQVQRCPLATQAGFVVVVDDSSSKCVQGETWGWEIGSVWVSKRCEADFAIAAPVLGRTVRCEARGADRVECRVDPRGGVIVLTEHRPTRCEFGRNWGLNAGGLWVDPDCGATFLVDGRLRGSAYWSQPPTLACGAPGVERDFCPADSSRGVRLLRETGAARCQKNITWGWSAQGIWTSGGCQAEFALGR